MRFLRVTAGPLLLLVLVGAAAVACLAGPEQVGAVVGSAWFFVPAGLLALAAPVKVLTHGRLKTWRNRLLFVAHLGMTLAMVGVWLNQRQGGPGIMFVETGGVARAAFLQGDMRLIDVLEQSVRLDSVRMRSGHGFRPGPVAWVRAEPGTGEPYPLTWNNPWSAGGRQVMLSRAVDAGYPEEFELKVGDDEYVLMHNQRVRLPDGTTGWSRLYDRRARRLQLVFGGEPVWLATGDTVEVGGVSVVLGPVHLSRRQGVMLLVKQTGMRSVLFLGLGLMLLGFLPALTTRRRS